MQPLAPLSLPNSKGQVAPILSLPSELLAFVLTLVPFTDIPQLAVACKFFRQNIDILQTFLTHPEYRKCLKYKNKCGDISFEKIKFLIKQQQYVALVVDFLVHATFQLPFDSVRSKAIQNFITLAGNRIPFSRLVPPLLEETQKNQSLALFPAPTGDTDFIEASQWNRVLTTSRPDITEAFIEMHLEPNCFTDLIKLLPNLTILRLKIFSPGSDNPLVSESLLMAELQQLNTLTSLTRLSLIANISSEDSNSDNVLTKLPSLDTLELNHWVTYPIHIPSLQTVIFYDSRIDFIECPNGITNCVIRNSVMFPDPNSNEWATWAKLKKLSITSCLWWSFPLQKFDVLEELNLDNIGWQDIPFSHPTIIQFSIRDCKEGKYLQIKNCTRLESLSVQNAAFRLLICSDAPNLQDCIINDCVLLQSLSFIRCDKLDTLIIRKGYELQSLDLSNLNLEEVLIDRCINLISLLVGGCTKLRRLVLCGHHRLSGKNSALETLDLRGLNIEELDLDCFLNLTTILVDSWDTFKRVSIRNCPSFTSTSI